MVYFKKNLMLLEQRVSFNALHTIFVFSWHSESMPILSASLHTVVSLIFMGINFHGIDENQFHGYLNW